MNTYICRLAALTSPAVLLLSACGAPLDEEERSLSQELSLSAEDFGLAAQDQDSVTTSVQGACAECRESNDQGDAKPPGEDDDPTGDDADPNDGNDGTTDEGDDTVECYGYVTEDQMLHCAGSCDNGEKCIKRSHTNHHGDVREWCGCTDREGEACHTVLYTPREGVGGRQSRVICAGVCEAGATCQKLEIKVDGEDGEKVKAVTCQCG